MEKKRMAFKSNLGKISLTLIVFLLPFLLFIFPLFSAYSRTGTFNGGKYSGEYLGFVVITCFISLPGLLLHYKYYLIDKGKTLELGKGHFGWTDKQRTTKIAYTDLLKVEMHYLYWKSGNPWSEYGYVTLFLKNGTQLTITCLTYQQDAAAAWFGSKNIRIKNIEEIYPW
jgi:hypothetical protein